MSRIAIVSDAIFPYNNGGKETRIYELSTRLAASGHDVHIYTMHWWSDAGSHRVENGVHLHAISPLYPLHAGERRSIRQGILFGLACFKLITAKFDVIDVDHMPYFPLFSVRIVTWLKRKPMYATWHEVWGRAYWKTYLGRLGIIGYVMEKLTVLLPNQIIAVSDMTAARLRKEMGVSNNLLTVYNGIDLNSIAKVRAASTKSDVLYAGRLLKHKNVDVLLRAVARLKRTRFDISCVIVGDGPQRLNLEKLAVKLGIEANVRFVGFLPENSQVYAYMKASSVFVLPSTREGFGISVIEANACGLPVVTIDAPANAARYLISTSNGRLAKLTPASIATQIEVLLTSPVSVRSVKSTVKSYDWRTSATNLSLVYAS